MPDRDCFCGSGKMFSECCKPFISGEQNAPTAEQLMRSRYSAYATAAVEYLIKTCHPDIRGENSEKSLLKWCKSNQWKKLSIISTYKGNVNDTEGEVTFKAFYLDSKFKLHEHKEHSYFVKEDGCWLYSRGDL